MAKAKAKKRSRGQPRKPESKKRRSVCMSMTPSDQILMNMVAQLCGTSNAAVVRTGIRLVTLQVVRAAEEADKHHTELDVSEIKKVLAEHELPGDVLSTELLPE